MARRTDCVLEWMKDKNIPLTRENYLTLAYMGDIPEPLGGEEEAEIPDEIIEAEEEIQKQQAVQLDKLKMEKSKYTD